jgi:hypothetical protein
LKEEGRLRVFVNRVLRRIFGPKRDKVTRNCNKLYHEELNDLYCSTNIIRVIKSRGIKGTGHVARMEERRVASKVFVRKLRERENFEDPSVDDSIILR